MALLLAGGLSVSHLHASPSASNAVVTLELGNGPSPKEAEALKSASEVTPYSYQDLRKMFDQHEVSVTEDLNGKCTVCIQAPLGDFIIVQVEDID
ncbi:MAG TPA: hypothetical protein ENJ82_12670 [Bacteroidetes bacterium]|nr:hypothetical protein [Bacteroidota bacterium]